MRYGENILEVQAKGEWVCPPCRGLCNCSFHRIRNGWAPTGTLYRRAIAEGALAQSQPNKSTCLLLGSGTSCDRHLLCQYLSYPAFYSCSDENDCTDVINACMLTYLKLAGYKSVAHYLVLTKQGDPAAEAESAPADAAGAIAAVSPPQEAPAAHPDSLPATSRSRRATRATPAGLTVLSLTAT